MKSVNEKKRPALGRCLINLVTAFAVTVVLVLAFALVLCYTDIDEVWIGRGARIISVFSVALAGALCARGGKSGGWLIGGISGAAYMVILYAVGYLVFGRLELDADAVVKLIYGVVAGIVGGIIGINLNGK